MILEVSKAESEKTTERYLNEQVKAIGGQSYKWVSPGYRGVHDRICIRPMNKVAFVEVKSEGEVLKDHQARFHKRLGLVTNCIYVVDTKHAVDLFILDWKSIT